MSNETLILLIVAALGHSVWNAIARQVPERDQFFTLILWVAIILYSPVALYLLWKDPVPSSAWIWMGLSIAFEVLYFASLARAYQVGTFLTVYPVARGSAPVFATMFSFLLTQKSVNIAGLCGIALIVAGILFIRQKSFSLDEIKTSLKAPGNFWALLTGVCTASYSVADSMGAAVMSAVLFKYIVFVGMSLCKISYDTRFASGSKTQYLQLLRQHPGKSLAGGFLVFGVNALVVFTMQSTPVAFVSATREMSIAFAVLIGVVWLKEKISALQIASIMLIVSGVIAIKVS